MIVAKRVFVAIGFYIVFSLLVGLGFYKFRKNACREVKATDMIRTSEKTRRRINKVVIKHYFDIIFHEMFRDVKNHPATLKISNLILVRPIHDRIALFSSPIEIEVFP